MAMRWFGGYVSAGPELRWPRPTGARILWEDPFPVWLVGRWPAEEIQTARRRAGYVAVLGPSAAGLAAVLAEGVGGNCVRDASPGAYAVVEATAAGLVVFTDLGSAWPVYTTAFGDGTAWGSSALALADLTGAAVDPRWLASALSDPAAAAAGHGLGSAFVGITAAPPGGQIELRPGCRPQATALPHVRPGRPAEAAGRLRQALENAVAVRVGAAAVPTSDLSGGLDSTSLCLLAARHVRSPARLTAVTIHPAGIISGGDLDYARAALRPGVAHVLLPLADEHLPYASLDQVPATDEPAPSTVTWARLAAQFALLRELGSDCHLTGDGGDTLLDPDPGYLAGLARSGRWLRLATHAQGHARLRQVSPWVLAARSVRRAHPVGLPGWLTCRTAELAGPGPHCDRLDANASVLREIQAVGRTARADAQLGDIFGLSLHNPYTDSSVIEAALSVPPWHRGDPWHYKRLLTTAVSDVLPSEIARRATKGAFDTDHHRGLRAHLPAVLDLADGRLAELGLVDPRRLRSVLRHAAAGLPTPFGILEPVIACEAWLRSLSRRRPAPWITSPSPELPARP
jgi:asparagine synthase (glutamine-hydrolysing)